jgi:2-succinyl-5-enolpyruvyl-6-hydroxy-3-cyclohexene-1-carboxylate synthase
MDKKTIPTLDSNICAEHQKNASAWMKSLGYKTYSVSNKDELKNVLSTLSEPSDSPIFIEVFTGMENDAQIVKDFYNTNQTTRFTMKSALKKTGNAVLNADQKKKIKKMLRK